MIRVYESFNVVFDCLLVFCLKFLYLYSSVILACNFLFWDIFVWLWYEGDGGLVEGVWKAPSYANFLKSFRRIVFKFSLII